MFSFAAGVWWRMRDAEQKENAPSVPRREAGSMRRIRMTLPKRTARKRNRVPAYVSLINWTDQGIKNFRESTKRAEAFTRLVEASGGKVRELLWTVGKYDIVSVVEFPDEESSVATVLQQGVRLGTSAPTPCGLFQLGRSRPSSLERAEPF